MKTIKQIAEEGFLGIPEIEGVSEFDGYTVTEHRFVKDEGEVKYKATVVDAHIKIDCLYHIAPVRLYIRLIENAINYNIEMYNGRRWFCDGDSVSADGFTELLEYKLDKLHRNSHN